MLVAAFGRAAIVVALLLVLLPASATQAQDAAEDADGTRVSSVSHRLAVAWAEVRSDDPRRAFWKVRRDLGSGRSSGGVRRTYYVFDISRYADQRVVQAEVVLERTAAASCRPHATSVHLAGAVGRRTTWRNAPEHGPALYVSRLVQACEGNPGRVEWDVSAGLQQRIDAGASRAVFLVRSRDEGTHAAYTTHDRRGGLRVISVSTPNAPTGLEVNHQGVCGTAEQPVLVYDSQLTPTFRLVQSSPEQGASLAPVFRGTDVTTGQPLREVVDGPPRSQGLTAVPAWALESGHTYEWRVASRREWQDPDLSHDYLEGPEAGPCYFTMQGPGA